MRIHIQNLPDDRAFAITSAQWGAAAARAPEVSRGHAVTYGETPEAFQAAIGVAEAVGAQTGAVRRLFPADAPQLKLIYCTAAGLDSLAPFDWLPPGAALLNNRGTHAVKAGEYGIMALLMLAAVVLDWTFPSWASFGLVAAFVGGFVFLVATMPRDGGDGWGDGAVV